jgi:hypothetical protein
MITIDQIAYDTVAMCKRVRVSMKEFSRKYNAELYSRNKQAILSCLSYIHARTQWGKEVKFKYAKVVKFVLTHFFSEQVRIVEDLAKVEGICLPS